MWYSDYREMKHEMWERRLPYVHNATSTISVVGIISLISQYNDGVKIMPWFVLGFAAAGGLLLASDR